MAKGDGIIDYSDLIADDGTFEEISANIKQLKAELLDLAKVMKKTMSNLKPNDVDGIQKVDKELQELEQTQKNLLKTEKALQKAKKKTIELTNEELIAQQKNKIAQRERIAIAKQQAIIQSKSAGQIEKLRAQLALTTINWKKLSKEELNNGKKGKFLISTKKRLTDQLKKLEKQTGDTRRNVGNYSDSLGKLGKVAARVFVGRTIVDGLRSISNGVLNLIKDNRDADKSINDLGEAFDSTGSSLKSAALALLKVFAPALTAVANGIKFVIDLFVGAGNGVKEFSATSDQLAETTEALNAEFAKESAELAIVFTQLNKTNKGSEERKVLIGQINEAYGKYLPNLLTEESTLKDITKAQELANAALTQTFLLKIQKATLDDIVTNKVNAQIDSFEKLKNRADKVGGAINGNVAQFSKLVSIFRDVDGVGKLANRALTGAAFSFDRLNSEIRDSDPALASFIESINNLDAQSKKTLVEEINRAANTAKDYNDAINNTQQTISDVTNSIVTYDHAVTDNTKSLQENTSAQIDNSEARIKAIEEVEKLLEKAEISNIKDKQARLLELEESRYKEEQKLKKIQFEEDKRLLEGHEEELYQLQQANDRLAEQQEIAHRNKLAEIKAQFNKQEIDIVSIDVRKDALEDEAALLNEEVALVEEANEKKLKSNEKLLKGVQETAQKVGAVIVDIFKKQADLSKESVNEQQSNLERARERAQKGYKTNLAFEEKELSKKKLEQERRQKEAEQAAKILVLFNLVSAYASSGDTNAMVRGLIDFSFLTALTAGFEEGGFTGADSSNSTVKGLVHANEYVVTAADTARFGLTGKTGGEFGEAMSDYFDPQSPVQQNPYKAQKEAFKQSVKVSNTANSEMVQELKAIKTHLAKQPNVGIAIEEVYENVYAMIKKESKQTVTKISKKFLRGK